MRVLMQNRVDAFKNMGGDTIQMLKTKEELEKIGVKVDISLELEPDLTNYDLVHLFNITRIHETWMQFKNAKRQGKNVVLSTIHHKKSEIEEYEKEALIGKAKIIKEIFSSEQTIQLVKTLFYTIQSKSSFIPFLKQLKVGFINQQKEVLNGVDILLPNSNMEMDAIVNDFNLNSENLKYSIIPNGVEFDDTGINTGENKFVSKFGINDFVFCAGRIEPRKNQLNVINSLKDTGLKVVFAGAINKKHKKYHKMFMSEIENNKNFYYVGLLDREMMFEAYRAAKVSILASWFETTGLIGLEAAMGECNVVITQKGYTKEYYGTHAFYCSPNDKQSIKESTLKAFHSKFEYELKENVIKKFTWEKAAIKTKNQYIKISNIEE